MPHQLYTVSAALAVVEPSASRGREHLDQVIELTEPERAEWLAALSQTDPEMAELGGNLLGAHKREEFADFMEGASPIPVAEVAGATLIGAPILPGFRQHERPAATKT